ncbi:uncharacterized protein [Littorina saxatilis]|uniref:uncharacterized protein isoform X2 n=1 Tax=Littorina saxatilis TaxID=31220 RepID=UPI0038B5A769
MECVAIFADPSQAECLATSDTSLADYYYDCLTSVCDGDTSAVDPMNNYISDNCVPWLERSCASDADCPDGIHAECFKGKCLCTLGYYYSNGQDVCVDNCPVSDQQAEFLTYPGIYLLANYDYVFDADGEHVDNLVDCLAACAADAGCIIADFGIMQKNCARNSVSPLADTSKFIRQHLDFTLYQQRCK